MGNTPHHKRSRSNSAGGGSGGLSANVGSLLLFVGGVFAVVSAFLARQGFTGRDHGNSLPLSLSLSLCDCALMCIAVVGIDLGTTYSVVAISQKNNVTVIPDALGHVLIPSMVAFLPEGNVLVGRDARAHRTKDPAHTIFNAKRFIGRTYEDVVQSKDAASYEFAVSEAAHDSHHGVCFPVNVPGYRKCVSPIAIGATIVGHLRAMAHAFVGHNQITKAVIAVPVDFDGAQRAATQKAFLAAGLHVSRILEEPTAAAIAYGLHQDPSVNFILVFDFGGGTLDVSLLFTRAGSINVVDTIGDNNLGGEDLDAIVAEALTHKIAERIGTTLTSTTSDMEETHSNHKNDDPDQLPCTLAGIRRAAELLKRTLSYETSATASCVVQTSGELLHARETVSIEMTRAELEEICSELLARTLAPVKEIIEANHMTPEEIDAVVLVGGSSRIPWVREHLAKMFDGRAPLSDIDPDVAVAYGAARTLD
ncbi:Hsp70-like protein, partial [Globisporangium splendens]